MAASSLLSTGAAKAQREKRETMTKRMTVTNGILRLVRVEDNFEVAVERANDIGGAMLSSSWS